MKIVSFPFTMLCLSGIVSLTACGQSTQNQATLTTKQEVREELIVDKLTNPWGMEFLPDGSMLISEKEGRLIKFKDGKKTTKFQ